jgi:putative ABC transport system permease protein
MKYFPLIWYGIWRKKGRAILILIQIVIAFVLFGLLQGFKSGIDETVNKLSADLYIVQRATGFTPLPISMYERIKSVPGVRAVSYQSVLVGSYQKQDQRVIAFATDIETAGVVRPGLVMPKELIEAMQRTRTGTVASRELAAKYGWRVGDRIPLQVSQGPASSQHWAFDLVGLFDPGEQSLGEEFMFINYAYYDEARTDEKGTVGNYFVKVADVNNAAPVVQAIDKLFANSSEETRTESFKSLIQNNLQTIGDFDFIIRAVVGATLFSLLFSVGALMMQSVRERTSELAILKTIGFTDHKVFWIILTEIALLCVVGALIGLGAASLILPAAKDVVSMTLVMPRSVIGVGIGLALLLAVLSSARPAWRGLRLQVVDALAGR